MISIRLILESDIRRVKIIADECFEFPWSQKHFLGSIRNTYNRSYVYVLDEQIIGFLMGSKIFEDAEILDIAVLVEYQNNKIGQKLLNCFLSTLDKNDRCFLEVSSENKRAIQFYYKNEFKKESIRSNYYKDGSDAFILKRTL